MRLLSKHFLAGVAGILLLVAVSAVKLQDRVGDVDGFVEADFPFITTSVDAGTVGTEWPERNVAVRGVVVQLGNGAYVCFDPDLLRMAVGWTGDFLTLTSMAQVSYEDAGNKKNNIPRVLGEPVFAVGMVPGWMGATPHFSDPRPAGANPQEPGRGPLPEAMGRWNGLYVAGQDVVLSYTVRETDIFEQPGSASVDGEVGIVRTFRVGPAEEPLTLVVAEAGDDAGRADLHDDVALLRLGGGRITAAGVAGDRSGLRWEMAGGRYLVLQVPAGAAARTFSVVVWSGAEGDRPAFDRMLRRRFTLADFEEGGARRWRQAVTTHGRVAEDTGAYVQDNLTLPLPNPWERNVRVAGVDFFPDGRAALSTFEGDVWIVSGIDRSLKNISWRRFASGLYEPLNVSIVDGEVYVYGREGITRLHDLNGDGEADFYKSFSSGGVQTLESREYPLGMAPAPDGGFYLSKGGALDNGPQTSPEVRPGFRRGGPHSGTVLKVGADGQVSTFATGLREPFLGENRRTGLVTVSDQQGNFVPSTPIYVVHEGDYFGVVPTAHGADTTRVTPPIVWLPHEVDPSGSGQAWITSSRMGSLNGSMVHLSYGRPGLFRVYIDSTQSMWQGAAVPLPVDLSVAALHAAMNPVDGQLYVAGFRGWDSKARDVSGLVRIRYTGQPGTLPTNIRAGAQGVVLRFEQALDPKTATDPRSYGLERWQYRRTERYGSGHFRMDGEPGHDRVPLSAVHLSEDGRAVLLVAPDMREVMQMALSYDVKLASGMPMQDTAYLTINVLAPLDLPALGFPGIHAADDKPSIVQVEQLAEQPTAEKGRTLYVRMGCVACHSTDGTTSGKAGPSFKFTYGTVHKFTDGSTLRTDEAYIRQSILSPSSRIVEGYHEEMPSYLGVLSDGQIESITLFIKSLAREG